MNKILNIFVFILFVSFNGLTQTYPRTIIVGQDTCIAFSIEQSRTLILWNTQKDYYFELSEIQRLELVAKDSIIVGVNKKIVALTEIDSSYQQIIVEKDALKRICETEKKIYKSEIKRQKRRKILSIGVGILSTSFMTYLWIVK